MILALKRAENSPAARIGITTREIGAAMTPTELADSTLRIAAQFWLEAKEQTVSDRTAWDYKHYIRALNRFFGDLPLRDINIGHIVEYRSRRQATAGPARINHEVQTLAQILDNAGLWAAIARSYKPMRLPRNGPGQALLDEEADHLFEVATKKKRWKLAYLCELISVNTTCGPGEIRNLRLRDVDMHQGVMHVVGGAKNAYRVRPIELNTDAFWAMEQLLERAFELGVSKPEHFILPHRAHRQGEPPDPSKPMGSWKKAWYAIRNEAAKKYPRLKTVRMYDMRHHALTVLGEDPSTSEETILAIAGHVSRKMLERYSHIRKAKRIAALTVLEGLRKPVRPFLVQGRSQTS
jgi:integrase